MNFEIVPYDTTDVLGVGENLPFREHSFEAVLSLNVLEHVKYPFKCASEIARVMKPSATLYCVASFLQPLHAYPHHYYNMSSHGLKNLFDKFLQIEKQEVIASGLPIWTLSWFLNSWVNGLNEETKAEFLNMTVAHLIKDPIEYLEKDFVSKKLHPLDLKNAAAREICALLKPIQKHRKVLERLAKQGYS